MSMAISAGMKFAQYAERISDGMRDELYRRGTEITGKLRKAELEILSGSRKGIKHRSLKNRSSAPGEAPAAQSGSLREYWKDETVRQGNGHTSIVTSRIASDLSGHGEDDYAELLENGTSRMAARPFVDKIIEKVEPEILEIARAPYGPYL